MSKVKQVQQLLIYHLTYSVIEKRLIALLDIDETFLRVVQLGHHQPPKRYHETIELGKIDIPHNLRKEFKTIIICYFQDVLRKEIFNQKPKF